MKLCAVRKPSREQAGVLARDVAQLLPVAEDLDRTPVMLVCRLATKGDRLRYWQLRFRVIVVPLAGHSKAQRLDQRVILGAKLRKLDAVGE